PVRIDAGGWFTQVGMWACVARSRGGGVAPGPWSAPTATEAVQTGFYPKVWHLLATHGSTVRLLGRYTPPESAGGLARFVIRTAPHGRILRITRRIGRGGTVRLSFRLPHIGLFDVGGGAVGYVSFGGSTFAAARGRLFAFSVSAELVGSGV